MPKYDVTVGCNYPPDDTRAEPGDVIDVPEPIGKALIAAHAVKPHKAHTGDKKSKPTQTPTQDATKAPDGKVG